MKFNERIPKSERELEIFYRDSIAKLKNTESSLEDVESLIWLLFTRSQQQGQGKELEQLRADMMTRFAFVPNYQQEINDIIKSIEDVLTKIATLPNNQQEIRNVQRNIDDSTTLNLMRL